MKKIFSAMLILVIFFSCKKDTVSTDQIFRFNISNNYVPQGYQYWIVISDNGNILYNTQIQNGQSYQFNGIKTAVVDVNIFIYFESLPAQNLYVQTYAGVKPDTWTLNTPYPSYYYGEIAVSVNDLVSANYLAASTSQSFTSNLSTSLTVSANANPENVLVTYQPNDNSPLRYKYIQNVAPTQSINLSMADFQTTNGLLTYNLPVYNYFNCMVYGYNANPNVAKYRFCNTSYYYSSNSTFNLYYPTGLFQNYFTSFYFADNNDITRAAGYDYYGAMPTNLPTISYADINLSNENNIDNVTAQISNPENYQDFTFDYYASQDTITFEWNVVSKSSATISNVLPELPLQVKQKSSLYDKSNLNFTSASLFKYITGQATSYDDFITMCIKPSKYFNDVVPVYSYYYQFAFGKKKSVEMKRPQSFINRK